MKWTGRALVSASLALGVLLLVAPSAVAQRTFVGYSATGGLDIEGSVFKSWLKLDLTNNQFVVQLDPNGPPDAGELTGDSDFELSAIQGCVRSSSLEVRCAVTGARTVIATLSNSYDRFDSKYSETDVSLIADGEFGDDKIFGGPGPDTISGGTGNDRLDGFHGDDTVNGGDGDDALTGWEGSNTLNGGADDDFFMQWSFAIGADSIAGGTGVDTVSYEDYSSPVTVTLDTIANDGGVGEGDNVTGVQAVLGGRGGDDITGNAGANTLEGRDGNDDIVGGEGPDVLRGQAGEDVIDSRDGVPESVDCGRNLDFAIADLSDAFVMSEKVSTCERVKRFALDDGPPGEIVGRSVRIGRDGSLRLRLRCPRRARVACRGTLRVTHAGRRRRTLAKARYRVRRGRTGAVRLRLSRREAARARARRAIVARTKERGVSKKGPRSTVHLLKVRRRTR